MNVVLSLLLLLLVYALLVLGRRVTIGRIGQTRVQLASLYEARRLQLLDLHLLLRRRLDPVHVLLLMVRLWLEGLRIILLMRWGCLRWVHISWIGIGLEVVLSLGRRSVKRLAMSAHICSVLLFFLGRGIAWLPFRLGVLHRH